jgi:rRNA maturation protein Nop10
MKSIIKKQFIDCSDTDSFCFSLICSECGKTWKSTPIRFSKAGENASTEERRIILKILYGYSAAFFTRLNLVCSFAHPFSSNVYVPSPLLSIFRIY